MDRDEGEYIFLYPKNSGDIIDEATQQSNCLKTYIDKFQNGECIIIFMRTKDNPDESLVSIEIIDNKIVQAKQYMNRKITHEQENAIEKFATDQNINMSGAPYRVQKVEFYSAIYNGPEEPIGESNKTVANAFTNIKDIHVERR